MRYGFLPIQLSLAAAIFAPWAPTADQAIIVATYPSTSAPSDNTWCKYDQYLGSGFYDDEKCSSLTTMEMEQCLENKVDISFIDKALELPGVLRFGTNAKAITQQGLDTIIQDAYPRSANKFHQKGNGDLVTILGNWDGRRYHEGFNLEENGPFACQALMQLLSQTKFKPSVGGKKMESGFVLMNILFGHGESAFPSDDEVDASPSTFENLAPSSIRVKDHVWLFNPEDSSCYVARTQDLRTAKECSALSSACVQWGPQFCEKKKPVSLIPDSEEYLPLGIPVNNPTETSTTSTAANTTNTTIPTPVEETTTAPTTVEENPTTVDQTPVEETTIEETTIPTPVEETTISTQVEETTIPTPVEETTIPTQVEETTIPTPVEETSSSSASTTNTSTTGTTESEEGTSVPVVVGAASAGVLVLGGAAAAAAYGTGVFGSLSSAAQTTTGGMSDISAPTAANDLEASVNVSPSFFL